MKKLLTYLTELQKGWGPAQCTILDLLSQTVLRKNPTSCSFLPARKKPFLDTTTTKMEKLKQNRCHCMHKKSVPQILLLMTSLPTV